MPSGENLTVRRQFKALADIGVDVSLVSVATDDLVPQRGFALRTGANVALGTGLSPVSILKDIQPEIIHIHNLFPNISTRWLSSAPSPIVTTLHNYRPLCAAATLSRDGQDCTLCVDSSPLNSLRYRCYRGSAMATLPLTVQLQRGSGRHPVLRYSDLLLVPSPTAQRTYAAAGVDRLRVLLQPTKSRGPALPRSHARAALFVGRLSPEKGLLELLETWPANRALTVIGEGPLEDTARRLSDNRGLQVTFVGKVSDDDLSDRLRQAEALIFPSRWREGAPAVYAEALSAGLPVIAVTGNAVADFVQIDQTGVVLDRMTSASILVALQRIGEGSDELRVHCYDVYQQLYAVKVWEKNLRDAYVEAGFR